MAEKEIKKSSEPFRFYTRLHLSELTGLKAANLVQLLERIREVPGASIYHHTHRFLQQHLYLSPEPPNDFAYWVTEILREDALGEMLSSIDTIQFSTIASLREKIVSTIADYLEENEDSTTRSARRGEEFYFIKSISFVLPLKHIANDLKEFADILENVSAESVYFHMFEARLRLNRITNDFSYWIETSIGDKKLADEIAKLDPYTYTIEDLRSKLVKMTKKRIGI